MKITFPKIIYWLAKFLFALSAAFLLYIIFGVICYYLQDNNMVHFDFLDIKENPERVHLKIPIIDLGIEFPPKSKEVVFMITFFLFYAIYFYLMKNFFGIFSNTNSFVRKNLKSANLFIIVNIVPIVFWIIFSIYYIIVGRKNINYFDEDFAVLFIHIFVVLLVLLYKDILKKGIDLQEQNDLTI